MKDAPREGPEERRIREALPDLAAEKQKFLPTGAAKRIALEALKELAALGIDIVKTGGVVSATRLLTLGWRAVGIYRAKRIEALSALKLMYHEKRDQAVTDAVTRLEAHNFDARDDEELKDDFRAHLGHPVTRASAPAALSADSAERKELEDFAKTMERMEKEAAQAAEDLGKAIEQAKDGTVDQAAVDWLKMMLMQNQEVIQKQAEESSLAVMKVGEDVSTKVSDVLFDDKDAYWKELEFFADRPAELADKLVYLVWQRAPDSMKSEASAPDHIGTSAKRTGHPH